MTNVKDGPLSALQYDHMAQAYARDSVTNPFNAYYERPATISLLGQVAGQRVLEIGCGSGALTQWLVDNDATVTGLDVSEQMLSLAGRTIGKRARLLRADVAEPLPFADESFDVVVAALVLHYVRDWEAVLQELHRVLGHGGAVVISTHHPTMDWEHTPDDYFATTQVSEHWHKGSAEFEVTFWRRPLTAMTQAIAAAGFVIEQLVEPQPSSELRERDQGSYELLRTRPRFLFFRLLRTRSPQSDEH